jgi:hypothetical protein
MNSVKISAELEIAEAEALSQFLKRIGFSEFRSLSVSDEEAYEAQAGAEKIKKALNEIGFDPR